MSVLMIAVSLLGLCGNIFSICVLARWVADMGWGISIVLTVFCCRKEMRNCFNQILIAINVCDSTHLIFAILDAIRTSFGELYPEQLLKIFPYVHYPFYRYAAQYIHLIFHHIQYFIQNLLDSLHLPDNKCGNREILCSLQTSSLQVPSESESIR